MNAKKIFLYTMLVISAPLWIPLAISEGHGIRDSWRVLTEDFE